MLEKLKKRATAALPKVVNGVKALAKKATETVVGKFKESKAGKLIGKAVASVPASVNNTRNTISKISAAIPKIKQVAKNEVVKRVNTVQKVVNIVANTENYPAAKQMIQEKNQKILEKIVEQNKIFAADFIKGTTGVGALLCSTSIVFKEPLPGVYNPTIEVMNYLIQIKKAIAEEYPSIDWPSIFYKESKEVLHSYFNHMGNQTYNKKIPFLSDLIGAFTNCSDYQENGNQTPLDDIRYKIINDALIMAKPSFIPGVPGAIIKSIRLSQNENFASVEGAYDRGFLIEGAGGMAEGIINLVINPFDVAEGIVNIYKEPEKYIPAICKTANEYVNDKVIYGSPEDRAKLAGRMQFEAMALAASFVGGGAEAPGVLGKTAEASETMGKVAEAEEGLVKIAETEQKLTEFSEVAKIAKGAETTGELARGKNLIEELLGKMRKLFKGDIGPEEAGQMVNKEAGVSIRSVETGEAGKTVGSGGEAFEGAGKIPSDANKSVLDSIENYKKFYKESTDSYDCSEIAEDLLNASKGNGKVYEIRSKGSGLKIEEYGKKEMFEYHTVYSDGKYVYDPRYSETPIPEKEYFDMVNEMNPEGIIVDECN
ncbi:hypothetical protein [Lacrimispora sp.]|uniref:hypothetical protein n=1 Tax=Lacrimispora sp. TaxID=2719234 RepID=UPI0029E3B71A|nr:hypothetical protein [Lacrimispora sp.]